MVLSDQTKAVGAKAYPYFTHCDLVERDKASCARFDYALMADDFSGRMVVELRDCSETTEEDWGQMGPYSCHNLLKDFNFEVEEEVLADFDFRPFADTHKSSFDVRRGVLSFDSNEEVVDRQDFVGIINRR